MRWPSRTGAASFAERLRAAAIDPAQQKRAAEIRAVALEALGRIEDAYASYTEADNPDRLETRAHLAMALGRSGEAATLYGSLAAAHPNEPRFARNHALALRAAGRLEEAVRVYEGLVAGPSPDPADRRSLAWLLNLQRRYAEAWRAIEPLPRPAREAELLELQARTALWAGQREEAAQLCQGRSRRWLGAGHGSRLPADRASAGSGGRAPRSRLHGGGRRWKHRPAERGFAAQPGLHVGRDAPLLARSLRLRLHRAIRGCADPLGADHLTRMLARDGRLFTRYAVDGTPLERTESWSFYGAAPYLRAHAPPTAASVRATRLGDETLRRVVDEPGRYYDANWVWFGLALADGLLLAGTPPVDAIGR